MFEFARALRLSQQQHDLKNQTRTLIFIGTNQQTGFAYRHALQSFLSALQLAQQLHDPWLQGTVNGNLASLYSAMGDWPSAESQSAAAIAYFRKIHPASQNASSHLAYALELHADICFRLNKYPEGYKSAAEAANLALSIGDNKLEAFVWDIQGAALMRQGKISEAAAELSNALKASQAANDLESLAFVKEHLAELELKKKQPDFPLALKYVNAALSYKTPLFASHRQYFPIYIRARILQGYGKPSAALIEFQKAVQAANEWRSDALPGDISDTETVAALQEVYWGYVSLAADTALATHNQALSATALEVMAENRAASLRDQLRYANQWKLPDEYFIKLAQLKSVQAQVTLGENNASDQAQLDKIRVEIANLENQIGITPNKILNLSERNPRRNSLRDIQNKLGRGQVLISFAVGKEESFLWAVTRDSVNLSKLPGEVTVQAKAFAFADAVRNGKKSLLPALSLTNTVFSSLSPDVWGRSEWLLVADGPLLNGIPFAALPALRDKSIRLLPSELLLLSPPEPPLSSHFVGIGDPIYNVADQRLVASRIPVKTISADTTLARLVGSGREIRAAAIETHADTPALLTGVRATSENLAAALNKEESGIVHFAVHVISPPGQPQQAALALSMENGIPELLTPELIASFHANGSLVILSGCSSGIGKVLPGAGLMGLSRAWLLAGASAVVVSNWPTPDDSGKFFSAFYSHLNAITTGSTSQRAALALRQAQTQMSSGAGYQSSAAFWGAFAVVSKE